MRIILILVFALLAISSCKPRPFNQYQKSGNHQLRHGRWEEKYDSSDGELKARGKYHLGEKTGIWKWMLNGKKYQKDVIKKNVTKTQFYYPNGRIMSKGKSRSEISDRERIWYYSGNWKFYDQQGRLWYTKYYYKDGQADSLYRSK